METVPRRRRRWPLFFAAVLLAFAMTAAFLWWQGEQILDGFQEGEKARIVESARQALGVEPKTKLPGLRQAQTFLLVGSDVRAGSGETWGRSDTLLLARVYPDSKAVSILSLPRDLAVEIPGYGTDKINAAFSYGGPELLIETVSEWTGVKIDHYFQIGFEGFAEMVDSFGGALVPVDQRYYHSNEGLPALEQYSEIDLRPGYQRLGAEDALSFVRYRHGDSDIYRAARQQLFLREVSRQINEQASGNLLQIRALARSFADAAASDFDSLPEALGLARTLQGVPPSRIARITMEGVGGLVGGSYLIQVDPETKAETLRLWNNPEYFFNLQQYKRRATPGAAAATAWLDWLGQLAKASGFPETETTFREAFAPLKAEIRRSGVRSYDREGRSLKGEESLVDPDQELEGNPSPGILAGRERGLTLCQPQGLPGGWYWPEESRNDYRLEGFPATALYATRASGASILWMWTTWPDPPILQGPEDEIVVGNQRMRLYWESGRLRMIAWRSSGTWTWITNTIGNELDSQTMISLARSCQ